MTSGPVVALATASDHAGRIADLLEDAARQLRSGELAADQGVLVLRNTAAGRMHAPIRLGAPTSPVEVLGMLAYAQQAHYQDETAP